MIPVTLTVLALSVLACSIACSYNARSIKNLVLSNDKLRARVTELEVAMEDRLGHLEDEAIL